MNRVRTCVEGLGDRIESNKTVITLQVIRV